jgi:hypothetical protein
MNHQLLSHFSSLKDPRQSWKVLYPLEEMLLLAISGTLAGADNFIEIIEWSEYNLDFLKQFYSFTNGIPSHDTLNDVFNAIDGEEFQLCFISWINQLRNFDKEIIAVDGKTSRRTHDRNKSRRPLHTVSAWACKQRLVLIMAE